EKGSRIVQEAKDAASRGQTDVAMARALDAIEAAPRLALAHETLARFYLDLRRDAEKARSEAEVAIKLDGSSLDARRTRALALIPSARHPDALAEAAAIEALGGEGKVVAARVRGESALVQDDAPGAIRELEKAQKLAPRDARLALDLARAYLKAKRFQDAER